MKYGKLICSICCALFIIACNKEKNDPEATYEGLLYTWTYVTFTGVTTIDPISETFLLRLTPRDGGLLLQSDRPELNDVFLEAVSDIDSVSSHFGNDRVFKNELDNNNNRVYYLYENKSSAGVDSIWLQSFTPPRGGWNSKIIFSGLKLR